MIDVFDGLERKPRIQAAWAAVLDLLSDEGWHSHPEVMEVLLEAGVAERTAQNMLYAARRRGWVASVSEGGSNRIRHFRYSLPHEH